MDDPELVSASNIRLVTLARAYAAAGYEVEWLGLEDRPELREKYLADAQRGTDWIGEDDENVFQLMLASDDPPLIPIAALVNGTSFLVLSTAAELRPGVSRAAVLKYLNRVNRKLKLVRAYHPGGAEVVFDYTIPLVGDRTLLALVDATHRFTEITHTAITRYDTDRVLY